MAQMTLASRASLIVASMLCATVAASCSPDSGTATAAMVAANPGAACTSGQTMDGLKRVAMSKLDMSGYDPADKVRLSAQTAFAVGRPVVVVLDKDSRSVRCTGVLTFSWSHAILSKLKGAQRAPGFGRFSANATYEIRPAGAGNGLLYSIDDRYAKGLTASGDALLQALATADATAATEKYDAAIAID
jgi:hypothetical protein